MKKTLLITLLSMPLLLVYGQTNNNSRYLFKSGDKLHRQRIENFSIGEKENDIVWDYCNIKTNDRDYVIEYTLDGDRDGVITEIINNTRYYYNQDSVSIRNIGYENNNIIAEYDRTETILPFPLEYGKKVSGVFHGSCMYCENLMIRQFGAYDIEVDGKGTLLLPDGKTLNNVYRVHSVKETCQIAYDDVHTKRELLELIDSIHPFTADSITAFISNPNNHTKHSETYKWYAEGYRYPIIEAAVYGKGIDGSTKATAYYCAPDEQEKLYDKENEEIRTNRIKQQADNQEHINSQQSNGYDNNNPYSIVVNGTSITISSHTDSDFSATLSDSAGITYKSARGKANGILNIDCSGLRHGEYVIHVEIDGNIFSNKIKV